MPLYDMGICLGDYSPTLLMNQANGKDGVDYLSDTMVSLSDILMDVCFGLLEYTLYTIYPDTNQGTCPIRAIKMSKTLSTVFLPSVRE